MNKFSFEGLEVIKSLSLIDVYPLNDYTDFFKNLKNLKSQRLYYRSDQLTYDNKKIDFKLICKQLILSIPKNIERIDLDFGFFTLYDIEPIAIPFIQHSKHFIICFVDNFFKINSNSIESIIKLTNDII